MTPREIRSLALAFLGVTTLVAAGCGERDTRPGKQAADEPSSAAPPPPAPDAAPTVGGAPGATPSSGERGAQTAPDFTLEKLGGGSVQLSSLRGKVVLVDFWATWCGPCRASIPHLNSLYAAHREDGLEILGISLDRDRGNQTGRQLVEAFAKSTHMDYPVLMGSQATAASFGGVRAIPTAFLIDREGKIRNRYVGMQPPAVMQKAITALLAEEAPEEVSL